MELIDKKQLIRHLVDWKMEQFAEVGHEREFNLLDLIIKGIENEPTVEAKEVVHGYVKTVDGKMGVMHQECSVCGNALEWKAYPNYCDECGAKLDGADMRTSAE